MKKFFVLFFVAALAASGLFLSCSDESESLRYVPTIIGGHTVSFDSKGGSLVASQTVGYGETVTRPKNPTKENCVFSNWYYFNDRNYRYEIFDFTTPVVFDFELVAKWERTLTANGRPIKDVIMEMTESGTVKASGCLLLNRNENECYCDLQGSLLAKEKESPNVFITLDLSAVEGLETIGGDKGFSFELCSNLAGIVLPESVTRIDFNAFMHCHRLASVTIPNGVTRIDCNAFWNCSNLTSVTIPSSVTYIGYSAFSVCSKLESVIFVDANGWYCTRNRNYIGGYAIDSKNLANAVTAAQYLKSAYWDYYWYKN